MSTKKHLKLPNFKSEDEERDFWAKIDIGDYYSAKDFRRVTFPNLKLTSRPVSIRFPDYVLVAVKEEANRLGVPYQSLIKQTIAKQFALR